jgi:protein-disulfide isomerase
MEHNNQKSFFEKYQTFFSIIIAGLFIGGGIVLARAMPVQNAIGNTGNQNQPQGQTQDQVKSELQNVAKSLGLDSKALGLCLDNKDKAALIDNDVILAQKSGVQGTPTFIILKRTFKSDGTVSTEKQIPVIGARDASSFMAAITTGKAPTDQPVFKGDKVVLTPADHYKGPANAGIVIVEYSDIECPFCKRAKPTIDGILAQHPEYAFVYRQSPIVQLHPWAGYKAQASECIASESGNDAFWKFLDVVAK